MITRPRLLLSLVSLLAATAVALSGGASAQTGTNSQWPEVQGRGRLLHANWLVPVAVSRSHTGRRGLLLRLPDGRQAYGVTTLNSYRGRVSPYFNPHASPVPSTIR